MKKNRIHIKNLVNLDNYFSKKEIKLLFLVIVLAVLPSIFSGVQNMNLWDKFITVLENPIANIMFFLGIVFIVLKINQNICYNALFYFRFSNQRNLIINGIKSVTIAVLIFYITFIFVSVAASVFLCLGNYKLGMYQEYNIPIFIYVLFKFIKNGIVYLFISTIIFMIFNLQIKKWIRYFVLLFLLLFFFLPYENWIISHFYQIPIFFQAYLLDTHYMSFYLEMVIFLIYVFLIMSFSKLIFNYSVKRKNVLE